MKTLSRRNTAVFFAAIIVLLLSLEYWIVQLMHQSSYPELLSTGIAIDVTIGIPVLFYFLVVRRLRLNPLTLIPAFFASLWIATFLLPTSNQSFLSAEKKLIPVLEILLIAYVVSKIPGFVNRYRQKRSSEIFFSDAFYKAAEDSIAKHRALNVVLTEALLMYLAFAGWFKRFQSNIDEGRIFSYHRKSGYALILSIMCFLLFVETVAIHLVILHWSSVAANIVTALSIYSLFWLIGDFHAIRIHPIVITESHLLLRVGLRWKADIPLAQIAEVQAGGNAPAKSKEYLRASVLWPRLYINFTEPVEIQGMFGMRRRISKLGLSIDDADRFRETLLKSGMSS